MAKTALRPIDRFEQTIRHNYALAKGGMTYEEVGAVIGRTGMTANNRARDPLGMTLAEMFLLCQRAHIDPADFVGGELRLRGGTA